MSILALSFFNSLPKEPFYLQGIFNLGKFNYFTRQSAKEFFVFSSRLVASKIHASGENARLSIVSCDENENSSTACHAIRKANGLVAVLVCKKDYPNCLSFQFLSLALREFETFVMPEWQNVTKPFLVKEHINLALNSSLTSPAASTANSSKSDDASKSDAIVALFIKFQNQDQSQKNANASATAAVAKINKELDEVKHIMVQNIEKLLERGETIGYLMEKSNDLSKTSIEFYKKAKKHNQCCKLY